MALPLKYYNNNLVATLNLLESMGRHGCKRVRHPPSRTAALSARAAPRAPLAPHSVSSPSPRRCCCAAR